jgi:RimJ/RimL family protein N-acetyltransferase
VTATEITLRDGTQATLRPITAQDRDFIERGFEELSEQSRYQRFLSPVPHLSASQITYFTDVDHRDHEAIVAETDTGEPMGVARFVRIEPGSDTAEVAVTVVDRFQQRGLATALLARLSERAREEGVNCFTATVLATNANMIDVLEAAGEAKTAPASDGLVEMRVELRPEAEPETPLRRMLRKAAAGELWSPLLGRRDGG